MSCNFISMFGLSYIHVFLSVIVNFIIIITITLIVTITITITLTIIVIINNVNVNYTDLPFFNS